MTRRGGTTTVHVGAVTLHVTVNRSADGAPFEVFAKADPFVHQGECDGLCILTSLALQHGCPAETIVKHMRHRRYAPEGMAGQPKSISDAIALVLETPFPGALP